MIVSLDGKSYKVYSRDSIDVRVVRPAGVMRAEVVQWRRVNPEGPTGLRVLAIMDDQRRAAALDALRAKASASVTPRRPAMVAQPVQQAQAQHTPADPASVLDTPSSFKPGTIVTVKHSRARVTVLLPLGDGKRKVRAQHASGRVSYYRPRDLLRPWQAPQAFDSAEPIDMAPDEPEDPMLEQPQPPILDAESLRLRAILYNLQEVAAAKRTKAAYDAERHALGLALDRIRPDPLRNVVAPVEPEDDGRPKPKRKPR